MRNKLIISKYHRYSFNGFNSRIGLFNDVIRYKRIIKNIFNQYEFLNLIMLFLTIMSFMVTINNVASKILVNRIISVMDDIVYEDYSGHIIEDSYNEKYEQDKLINKPIQNIEDFSEKNYIINSFIEENNNNYSTIIDLLNNNLGNDTIVIGNSTLSKYDLPDKYYPGIDFSSFQPYMDYSMIKDKKSPAYSISHSKNAYTDEFGFRRYKTSDDQFTINGENDYIVALGTYYKEKGICGSRYLVVTTTGMYTIITGDEKSDNHTDEHNMFTLHNNGTYAGIIEWIVDTNNLEDVVSKTGTVTSGSNINMQGEILYIYGIN